MRWSTSSLCEAKRFVGERFLADARVADVRDLVVSEAPTIVPEAEIPELLAKMLEDPRCRHVYVVDGSGALVGSVRLDAVAKYLFPYTTMSISAFFPSVSRLLTQFTARKVSDIMDPRPRSVDDNVLVPDAVRIMWEEKTSELPVVDEKQRVVGEIDLLEVIAAYVEKTGKGAVTEARQSHSPNGGRGPQSPGDLGPSQIPPACSAR